MPYIDKNKVKLTIYVEPETFWQMDEKRNPKTSRSEYFSGIIEKSLGITV